MPCQLFCEKQSEDILFKGIKKSGIKHQACSRLFLAYYCRKHFHSGYAIQNENAGTCLPG